MSAHIVAANHTDHGSRKMIACLALLKGVGPKQMNRNNFGLFGAPQ